MIEWGFIMGLRAGRPLAFLVDVDHPDGPGYFWSGLGALEYDGKTYTGAGLLGGIELSRKSTDLRIDEIKLFLSGLPSDAPELVSLSEDVRNREASIRMVAISDRGKVMGSMLLAECLLDVQKTMISDTGDARLEVTGQTGFWTLERSTDTAYSREDAIRVYPNETGFDFIPILRNKDTKWSQA